MGLLGNPILSVLLLLARYMRQQSGSFLIRLLNSKHNFSRIYTVEDGQGEVPFSLRSGTVRECQRTSGRPAIVKGKIALPQCRPKKIFQF